MRTLWNGVLGFGLLRIPVKLYSASTTRHFRFDLLHKKDMGPIGIARICKIAGEEVPSQDIVRGYEYEKGNYIVVQKEDFERMNPEESQLLTLHGFVEEQAIDPKYYVKPYYVGPGEKADKHYRLFFEALKRSRKIAIGTFVFRLKEYLVAIKAQQDILMMYRLRFEDQFESLQPEIVPGSVELSSEEAMAADELVRKMSMPFRPLDYRDTSTEKLERFIEEKARGRLRPKTGIKVIKATPLPELLSALRASADIIGSR